MEGYALVTRENSVYVWDTKFRSSIILDMGSGPAPSMHVLPFTSPPQALGLMDPEATVNNVITRQNISR